jgi:hypothetical protein
MHVKEMGRADMDLIHLTQRKVHWWGVVHTILALRFQQEAEILSAERLLAFRGVIREVRGSLWLS